jgi:hypothetical protein
MEQPIREEIDMKEQIKEETREPEKLLSPKRAIVFPSNRVPYIRITHQLSQLTSSKVTKSYRKLSICVSNRPALTHETPQSFYFQPTLSNRKLYSSEERT